MALPDRDEITRQVLSAISKASGVPVSTLRAAIKRGEDPKLKGGLAISHQNFVDLALALRELIQRFNKDKTLLLREIENGTSTVKGVISTVIDRVGAV